MSVLLCPLCSQPRFTNLESLRLSLINAATQNISCPICNEVLLGLDKLTIHLFGHTFTQNISQAQLCPQPKPSRRGDTFSFPPEKSSLADKENSDLCLKLPESAPLLHLKESKKSSEEEKPETRRQYLKDMDTCYDLATPHDLTDSSKDLTLCTVNMEDLTFLTSWDNSVKTRLEDKHASGTCGMPRIWSPERDMKSLLDLKPWSAHPSEKGLDQSLTTITPWSTEQSAKDEPSFEKQWLARPDSNIDESRRNDQLWSGGEESQDMGRVSEPQPAGPEESCKTWSGETEDSAELSEYMSELLNKKLPILNFVFTMDSVEKGHDKKPLKCGTCGFLFQTPTALSMHEEIAHSKSQPSSKLLDTENHFLSEAIPTDAFEGKPGSPSAVGDPTEAIELFVTSEKVEESGRRQEMTGITGSTCPRYDCHLCSKSFKMKGSLQVHFKVAHFGLGPVDPGSISGNPGSPEERNFHCSSCNKSFKKEQHLLQHAKTHEGKQWQCDVCSKHFTTKYFLKKHQRLHTGEMPYSCPACKKTFTFQQSYHKHLLYHSDEKPHQCVECGRAFKELSTLHNHQRIHSGEKPFACETCGKCFRQRVSYIVHQRIHTGVLPYQCTACKKKFRYKVSQRSHKCTAQPPGIVVRQPGDLIQRILEHRKDILQASE